MPQILTEGTVFLMLSINYVMLLCNTTACIDVLRTWIELNDRFTNESCQVCLQAI